MYYEVYVDVLFVENLWMNAMLLLLTARAGDLPVRAGKIAAAACFGSLGACMLTVASAWLSGMVYFLGTFALAAGMVFIAFSGKGRFWVSLLFLYLEGFVLNGVLRYLGQFHTFSGVWFAVFSGISVLFLWAVQRVLRGLKRKRALTYPVILRCGVCEFVLEGLYDTGNGLYDPVSGKPVSILSAELLREILSKSGRECLPRIIPYRTICGGGVTEAYVLDEMEIQRSSESLILENPMLACMPEKAGQYQLILHRDLLSS